MFRDNNKVFILDGATGTELMKRGMPGGACPEKWVLENPSAIIELQRAYVDAGSMCVYAPTFGANRERLRSHGLTGVREYCRDLVALSREAVQGRVPVGGDISSTCLQLAPFGTAEFSDLIDIFTEQAEALVDAGADFFAIETQMSLPEARAAVMAVRSVSDKPVLVSLACGDNGRTVMGTDPVAGLLSIQALGADAYGVNCCSDLGLLGRIISSMRPYAAIPLIAKPNAGHPESAGGKTVYHLPPEDFAAAGAEYVSLGAGLIGGCCGTAPEHIEALARACAALQPKAPVSSPKAAAASQSRVADIDGDTEFFTAEINDDLLDSMAEALGEGADVLRLRVRDEDDIDIIDECQYALSMPLSVSFDSPELKPKFERIYHGLAHFE